MALAPQLRNATFTALGRAAVAPVAARRSLVVTVAAEEEKFEYQAEVRDASLVPGNPPRAPSLERPASIPGVSYTWTATRRRTMARTDTPARGRHLSAGSSASISRPHTASVDRPQ
jgi:hypothetical protein